MDDFGLYGLGAGTLSWGLPSKFFSSNQFPTKKGPAGGQREKSEGTVVELRDRLAL